VREDGGVDRQCSRSSQDDWSAWVGRQGADVVPEVVDVSLRMGGAPPSPLCQPLPSNGPPDDPEGRHSTLVGSGACVVQVVGLVRSERT
jgi:hypothetical protein